MIKTTIHGCKLFDFVSSSQVSSNGQMSVTLSPPTYSPVRKCGIENNRFPMPSSTKPHAITCGIFLSAVL